jgi:hypothetical protein
VSLWHCGGKPRQAEESGSAVPLTTSELVRFDLVALEAPAPTQPKTGRTAVFVDASASMEGFAPSIPTLLGGIEQAFSAIRDLHLGIEESRACFFSRSRGLFSCRTGFRPATPFAAGGFTNLDHAVREARQYDVTVVLTDGVPASLGGGGDCSTGVDGPCVARALIEALETRPGRPKTEASGFWILPLVSIYDGRLFTEQPLSATSFQPETARESVRNETGTSAEVARGFPDSRGDLVFPYRGPRVLMAWILASNADVGRAFVREFYLRAHFSTIERLDSLAGYRGGIQALPPVEVYPGAVPHLDWKQCDQVLDKNELPIESGGTFDPPSFVQPSTLLVRCAGKRVQGAFRVSASPMPAGSPKIRVLPPLQLSLELSASRFLLKNPEWEKVGETLKLQLTCEPGWQVRCSEPVTASWSLLPQYKSAADDVAANASPSARYVSSLSTKSPAQKPHAVYGLSELLESFYRRQLAEHQQALATLKFCQVR